MAPVTASDCLSYRLIAMVFTGISFLSFCFNIHFLTHNRHRFNPLALSLIANSIFLMSVSVPYVTIQAITCAPVRSFGLCTFQGFACFTCGVCVMYTMSLLALVQYVRLFYHSSWIYRVVEHRKNYLIPIFCWLLALCWSLPPFLNVRPGFIREGQGFDCGLNWVAKDPRSYAYISLAFICIYFLPLFCLLYTNIRILITIRRLIYRRESFTSKSHRSMSIDTRHRLIDIFTVAESSRLRRLRIDRRFAQATMITVLHYLLAWTPYALGGIFQMTISIKEIPYQLPPMLLTVSALTAKSAVIGQACVYYYTVRPSSRRLSLTSATLK